MRIKPVIVLLLIAIFIATISIVLENDIWNNYLQKNESNISFDENIKRYLGDKDNVIFGDYFYTDKDNVPEFIYITNESEYGIHIVKIIDGKVVPVYETDLLSHINTFDINKLPNYEEFNMEVTGYYGVGGKYQAMKILKYQNSIYIIGELMYVPVYEEGFEGDGTKITDFKYTGCIEYIDFYNSFEGQYEMDTQKVNNTLQRILDTN